MSCNGTLPDSYPHALYVTEASPVVKIEVPDGYGFLLTPTSIEPARSPNRKYVGSVKHQISTNLARLIRQSVRPRIVGRLEQDYRGMERART